MASVYLAFDMVEDRRVALKVLTSRLPDDVTRFKREFRAASRLRHPACVEVYDLGEHAGDWFFTMEHLPGGSLFGKKLSPRAAVAVVIDVLGALDHIHSRQIVHRDLKPSNILLAGPEADPSSRVKLADFGIARVGDTEHTFNVGEVLGTLRYFSPEQARSDQVDPRSDLYSLGLILFELLTGQFAYDPITTDAEGWLRAHGESAPRPFSATVAKDLTRLEPVVRRLLEKEPAARFATAADAHDALTAWLDAFEGGAPQIERRALERGAWLAFPEMVGRTNEANLVTQHVAAALRGDLKVPHLIVVHGEAGLGKSRLVSRALPIAAAADAWTSLSVCRTEPGAAYEPLLPIVNVFGDGARPARGEDDAGEVTRTVASDEATLAGTDPTMLASADSTRTLVRFRLDQQRKENADVDSSTSATRADSAGSGGSANSGGSSNAVEPVIASSGQYSEREAQQWQFHRRIADGLIAFTHDRPVLILIDDVQWADAPTLSLIGYLVRAVHQEGLEGRAARLAFVVTHRPAEDNDALQSFKELAASYGQLVDIGLKGLDAAATSHLVRSMMPGCSSELANTLGEQLNVQGAGNPLYVAQALHALVSSKKFRRGNGGDWEIDGALDVSTLPASITDAIGERAARFPSATKQTLTAAAVVGRTFDVLLLADASGLDATEILDGLDEGVREGFIEEVSSGKVFRFAHDRFREAIYSRLPRETVVDLHKKIADALAPRVRRKAARRADLAFHELRAERWPAAYRHSLRAAREAMLLYAWAKAADLYGQAIVAAEKMNRQLPRGVLERSGDVSLQAGRFDAAAKSYGELLARQRTSLERADTLRRLADVAYRRGDVENGSLHLKAVLTEVECSSPTTPFGLALGIVVQIVLYLPFALLPAIFVRKEPQKDERRAIIARTSMMLMETSVQESLLDGGYHQLVAMVAAERLGPSVELVRVLAQQGVMVAFFGLTRLTEFFYARAFEIGKTYGDPWSLGIAYTAYGLSIQGQGDLPRALVEHDRAEVALEQAGDTLYLRWNWLFRAQAHAAMGDCLAADKLARRIYNLADEVASDHGRAWAQYLRGRVATIRGALPEAIQNLTRAAEALDACGDHLFKLSSRSRLAQAWIENGDYAAALEITHRCVLERRKRRVRMPHVITEGAFLASAAAYRKNVGALAPEMDAEVDAVVRWGGHAARSNRLTEPLFNAGLGAIDVVRGHEARGLKKVDDAIALAHALLAPGEAVGIHVLATKILDPNHAASKSHHEALRLLRSRPGMEIPKSTTTSGYSTPFTMPKAATTSVPPKA